MVLAASLGMSCSEKKKSNVIIAQKPVVHKTKAIQKMSEYEQSRDIEWIGSTYKIIVKRTSDLGLSIVKIDADNRYYDNKIVVRILRKDGTEFFNRTFLKTDFSEYLDSHTQESGALLGIVYVKADSDYLYFAASVGSPDVTSDEYVPLVLKISRMGSVSVSKDQNLDTDGDEKASETRNHEKAPSDEDEAGV